MIKLKRKGLPQNPWNKTARLGLCKRLAYLAQE